MSGVFRLSYLNGALVIDGGISGTGNPDGCNAGFEGGDIAIVIHSQDGFIAGSPLDVLGHGIVWSNSCGQSDLFIHIHVVDFAAHDNAFHRGGHAAVILDHDLAGGLHFRIESARNLDSGFTGSKGCYIAGLIHNGDILIQALHWKLEAVGVCRIGDNAQADLAAAQDIHLILFKSMLLISTGSVLP